MDLVLLVLIGATLLFAVIIGTIFSFINLGKIGRLERKVNLLSGQLNDLQKTTVVNADIGSTDKDDAPIEPEQLTTSHTLSAESPPPVEKAISPQGDTAPKLETKTTSNATAGKPSFSLDKLLQGNTLLWLGAVILALGGIFLAKYSIEAGLFPPGLRMILGGIFGLALVGLAEYLFRHPTRFNIQSSLISAALASGGTITCFAMTYVAFDFYAFLSPIVAFGLLAVIAIAASWLSIRYGPILAAIGVLGAYIVPALISTGSNDVNSLLAYVSLISMSSILVYNKVQAQWLWVLTLVGHSLWLVVSMVISFDLGLHSFAPAILLFCMFTIYLFTLMPVLGAKLTQYNETPLPIKTLLIPRKEQLGVLISFASLVVFNYIHGYSDFLLLSLLALSVVFTISAFRHSAFDTWPFVALLYVLFCYFNMPSSYDFGDNLFPFSSGYLLIQVSAIASIIYAMMMLKYFPTRGAFHILLVLSPLLLFSVSYASSEPQAATYLYPIFSIELAIIAAVFSFLATRTGDNLFKLSYLLLANGCIALLTTMLLDTSILSLSLTIQIVSMMYLGHKYQLSLPNWIIKVALACVLLRLSIAPWIAEYAYETILGVQWTWIVYPLVIGLIYWCSKKYCKPGLQQWFNGSLLHLIALFVTTQTSYLLVGSYPSIDDMSYKEFVVLSLNYCILAFVYLYKGQSSSMQKMYRFFAFLLLLAVAFIHSEISFYNNPFTSLQDTGSNMLFNYLVLQWLLPIIPLISIYHLKLLEKPLRRILLVVSGVFLILYINAVIRLAFNDSINLWTNKIEQSELYTYSIVWLLIACLVIVTGQRLLSSRALQHLSALFNKAGFAILFIVVLKAFIVDMSNLSGLYRALSFIGLGLCLVAIGWLFQRFTTPKKDDLTQ